ncbi:MAG TPA: glycosyltransferase, partial [Candidatus Dormibacteraeota bacterium]|nr:glycosyltransferase [Candidatus Dormibacteraeota bacterium]
IRRERLLALRLARRADAVVVPSRATGGDVERLGHVDPARIHVIPHGVAAAYAPAPEAAVARLRARLGLGDRRYLLAVGTLDERKRRDTLAATVALVRRDADVALVVAGDQGVYTPLVAAALEREGVRPATTLAGHVTEADLVTLYTGAAALVFPTAYEGFGLPVLEALACGTRVACFDNSSLPEVAGDAAETVPDADTPALARAVGRILAEGDATRAERIAAGRARAAEFTWERSARAHLAVYDAVEARDRARPASRRG